MTKNKLVILKGELYMDETTSTSNEGSRKRDLSKYQQVKTKNVTNKELDKLYDNKNYSDLKHLNCIAFDVKTNQKEKGGSNPVSASSADTYEYDFSDIANGVVLGKIFSITPEKSGIIIKKRKQAKKLREEKKKEAKNAEEVMKDKENPKDEEK